jgi:predicted transcriptional regulator
MKPRGRYNRIPYLDDLIKNLLFNSPKTFKTITKNIRTKYPEIPGSTIATILHTLETKGEVKKDKYHSKSPNRPLYVLNKSQLDGFIKSETRTLTKQLEEKDAKLVEIIVSILLTETAKLYSKDLLTMNKNKTKFHFPILRKIFHTLEKFEPDRLELIFLLVYYILTNMKENLWSKDISLGKIFNK